VSIIACVVLQGKLCAGERVYREGKPKALKRVLGSQENRKPKSVCKAKRKTVRQEACAQGEGKLRTVKRVLAVEDSRL